MITKSEIRMVKIPKIQVIMKILFNSALLTLSIGILTGCCSEVACQEEYDIADRYLSERAAYNLNELTNSVDGILTYEGWEEGYKYEYDSSKLTKSERNILIEKGIKNVSQKIDSQTQEMKKTYSEILARYYDAKKDVQKKAYWSLKGANNGSSHCMALIAIAYKKGEGVQRDLNEAMKWAYLAVAAGHKIVREEMQKLNINSVDKGSRLVMVEGKRRADEWMKLHPNIISSNQGLIK